jgi:hypothetical protein
MAGLVEAGIMDQSTYELWLALRGTNPQLGELRVLIHGPQHFEANIDLQGITFSNPGRVRVPRMEISWSRLSEHGCVQNERFKRVRMSVIQIFANHQHFGLARVSAPTLSPSH